MGYRWHPVVPLARICDSPAGANGGPKSSQVGLIDSILVVGSPTVHWPSVLFATGFISGDFVDSHAMLSGGFLLPLRTSANRGSRALAFNGRRSRLVPRVRSGRRLISLPA